MTRRLFHFSQSVPDNKLTQSLVASIAMFAEFDIDEDRMLGCGTFGVVLRGTRGNVEYALKCLHIQRGNGFSPSDSFRNFQKTIVDGRAAIKQEYQAMKMAAELDGAVTLPCFMITLGPITCLATQLKGKGLHEFSYSALSAGKLLPTVARQIVAKMMAIEKKMIHCDVKTNNFVFDGQDLYLIDFGSARVPTALERYLANPGTLKVLPQTKHYSGLYCLLPSHAPAFAACYRSQDRHGALLTLVYIKHCEIMSQFDSSQTLPTRDRAKILQLCAVFGTERVERLLLECGHPDFGRRFELEDPRAWDSLGFRELGPVGELLDYFLQHSAALNFKLHDYLAGECCVEPELISWLVQ